MAIFLHFLNRETYRATDSSPDIARVHSFLRTCSVSLSAPLISNFSNILEGGYLTSIASPLFHELIANDQLVLAGERPTVAEFLDSRRERYAFDAGRYPMYFAEAPDTSGLQTKFQNLNQTDYLHNEIKAIRDYRTAATELLFVENDVGAIPRLIDDLCATVENRQQRAITLSLFSANLVGVEDQRTAARLISALYIRKYVEDLSCEIPIGIPELFVFDGLARDPYSHDLQILNSLLSVSGIASSTTIRQPEFDKYIATLRGTGSHQNFASRIEAICRVLRQQFDGPSSPSLNDLQSHRSRAQALLSSIEATVDHISVGVDFYREALRNLEIGIHCLRKNSRDFAESYEIWMSMNEQIETILIVTATDTETNGLYEECSRRFGRNGGGYLTYKRFVAKELGFIRSLRLVHVQCEAGSVGPASSQAVITDAIEHLKPSYVVLAGIAFGADESNQEMGDILVSKMVVEYERAKVLDTGTVPRGQRIESSPKLINVLRMAKAELGLKSVFFGPLLSGEKLVDSEQFLNDLLDKEPEAIGGEMEGAGLVAAASRHGVDWIVVKGIVDWAKDKRRDSGSEHQTKVSKGVFAFLFEAFERIGI